MKGPEVIDKALTEKNDAEKKTHDRLNGLKNAVRKDELLAELKPDGIDSVDQDVKDLLTKALTDAQNKTVSLREWTANIYREAKEMNPEKREQVTTLVAKITARQGAPSLDRPVVSNENTPELPA